MPPEGPTRSRPHRRRRAEEAAVRRTESERAIDLAYKAVGRRELTVAELRTRLERKRVAPEAIDDAVAELAASRLPGRRPLRPPVRRGQARARPAGGRERIARDLRRRGIAPQLIEAVVADRSRDAELRTALLLLQQRYPRRRGTTASATAPGSCWSAAATSPSSPTTRSGACERTERERRRAA